MNKEQQDLSWACLPKEVRKEVRMLWELDTLPVHPDYGPNSVAEGAAYILTDLFGHHNLTSDTEPEELLMVERKKVVEWYSSLSNEHKIYAKGTTDRISLGARLAMIEELFGDKCLPDKEESVQVEPKFKKDEVVRSKSTNKALKIYSNCAEVEKSSCLCVDEDGLVMSFPINDLEPYVEPKFKVGDKVYQTSGTNRLEEYTIKKVYKDKS